MQTNDKKRNAAVASIQAAYRQFIVDRDWVAFRTARKEGEAELHACADDTPPSPATPPASETTP
jgi:hypothetical protein